MGETLLYFSGIHICFPMPVLLVIPLYVVSLMNIMSFICLVFETVSLVTQGDFECAVEPRIILTPAPSASTSTMLGLQVWASHHAHL